MAVTDISVPKGQVWAAHLFLLSLLVPFHLPVGSWLLMPHRILILVLFVPFFVTLFILRRAGPVLAIDLLLLGASLWVGVSLFVNHPFAAAIEPFGIHFIEFFGAYLIARVAIRSAADFERMITLFFWLVMLLLPFAAAESILKRPILLEILPNISVYPVDAGERLGLRRAQTIFAHPILFGVFVSTGLGLFWYVLRPRWIRFLAAPAVALATLFSLSTGALISIVMQSTFIGWELTMKTLRKRWTLFAGLAVLGYFAVDVLSNRTPFHVLVEYATFSTGSAYNRILIWQHGTDNVWANPFFGLGLKDWVRPTWMSSSVDNFWLLMAMRYGLPAIAMILLAVGLIFSRVSRASMSDPRDQLCRAAYLVTIGGLSIAGGTVHYWHAMMAFALFIFGSGIWTISGGLASTTSPVDDVEPDTKRRSPYTRQPQLGQPIASPNRRAPVRAARRG